METMIGRAKGMMLEPRATWKEIDTEFTKSGEVWGKYTIPLAAIGPIAATVGMILFGRRVPLTSLTTPVSITTAISSGIAAYVLALLSVFVLSRVISLLAPGFGGQRNDVRYVLLQNTKLHPDIRHQAIGQQAHRTLRQGV